MCWCPKTSEHACGWPPKTVRALLAVITVLLVLSGQMALVIYLCEAEKYSEAISVCGMMAAQLSAVIGWYFGSSRDGAATPADVESPLEERDAQHSRKRK